MNRTHTHWRHVSQVVAFQGKPYSKYSGLKDRVGRSGRVLPCPHLNGTISLDI